MNYIPGISVLLTLFASVSSQVITGKPVDLSPLVGFVRPGDTIDVIYMEAPLLYKKYGDLLSAINAYHAGFGLLNRNTGLNFTVEFGAPVGVLGAVFPSLIHDSRGNITGLNWTNQAIIELKPGIDLQYWHAHHTWVYTMTSDQFNQFACWMPTFDIGTLTYNLFIVEDGRTGQVYMPALTCVDFCWDALNVLHNIGATPTGKNASRDWIFLKSNEKPTIADFSNPAVRQQIFTFYYNWQLPVQAPNESLTDFFLELAEKASNNLHGPFFYYVNGSYYQMTLYQQAPFLFYYSQTDYGKGPRNPNSVSQQSNCMFFPHGSPSHKKDDGLSGGSIFLIILTCLVFVYFVGGFLLNTFHFKREGLDRIPNRDMWKSLGSLVADGVIWTYTKVFKRTGAYRIINQE